MSFLENENTLHVIQSEINKLNKNLTRNIKKKELKKNKYLRHVNENIISSQRKIMEARKKQINQIEKLQIYLEKHYDEKSNWVSFQLDDLAKLKTKLQSELNKM